MKLGLKYPQLFAAVASLSGALASAQAEWEKSLKDDELRKLLGGVFGPLDNPSRAANDLFELVKRISPDQLPQLYFSVGEGDRLLEENRRFARLLSDLKINYQYREVPGPHEWPVWDQQIQVVLALQAPVIAAATASRP